jgi:predicted small secreted protein
MKRLILFCLAVLLGLYFLTSCENQTDGLLPNDVASADAPPAYVMAAVKLKYPNATDVRITIIEPNKIWKVEFTVNGEMFETFIDENGKTITNGRLGTVDENDALAKVMSYLRSKKRNHMFNVTHKVMHPSNRKVLNYYVVEYPLVGVGADIQYAYLFDNAGNFINQNSKAYDYNDIKSWNVGVYYDLNDKKITWLSHSSTLPTTANQEISKSLDKLGWADFSGITPVLSSSDYPNKTQRISLEIKTNIISSVGIYYSYLSGNFGSFGFLNMRHNWTDPTRMKYSKYFEEEPSRFSLYTNSQGTPLYVLENMVKTPVTIEPYVEVSKINQANQLPATVLNELLKYKLPSIKQWITGEKTVRSHQRVNFESYHIFYKGEKNELVQFSVYTTNPTESYGYQTIIPIEAAELPAVFVNAVRAEYPNMKPIKYHRYDLYDKGFSTLEANGFEIIFEDNGKTYSASGVGAVGFDKPIILQLF